MFSSSKLRNIFLKLHVKRINSDGLTTLHLLPKAPRAGVELVATESS
ncbi:hypothetical protein [Prochlorococcus marinus]|nr:hypothetical protein [Prochlorococcus marinus]